MDSLSPRKGLCCTGRGACTYHTPTIPLPIQLSRGLPRRSSFSNFFHVHDFVQIWGQIRFSHNLEATENPVGFLVGSHRPKVSYKPTPIQTEGEATVPPTGGKKGEWRRERRLETETQGVEGGESGPKVDLEKRTPLLGSSRRRGYPEDGTPWENLNRAAGTG